MYGNARLWNDIHLVDDNITQHMMPESRSQIWKFAGGVSRM